MGDRGAIELREYLRRHNPTPNEQFDEFLAQVVVFFKLRMRAEEKFLDHPHTAKGRQGALPLDWNEIAELVATDEETPPEDVVTQIARECLDATEEITASLRKVLVREREKVSLGLVQQVDAQCLRWLTRQPGRDGLEKAGERQRILAVVRRENYNTLENRVFKDYLTRTAQETAIYLRRNEKRFPEHDIIKRVRRLRNICENGMRDPWLEDVSEIKEMPMPNYVLRQERRYARIWKAYMELVRQAAVAERLWNRREEVATTLQELRREGIRQTNPRARFHAPIWFNPLDGRHALLESPFYVNEWLNAMQRWPIESQQDDVIIDLAGGSLQHDLLIYGQHPNAKPYLQNYARPSIEDRSTGNTVFLSDLLSRRDGIRLKDFMEQLYARLGGKRWFLLVPDDWDGLWQEAIIKAVPLARNRVFLVWRSIAAAIGGAPKLQVAKEGDELVIIDLLQNGQIQMTRLTLTKADTGGQLVPQRRAYKLGETSERYNTVEMGRIDWRQKDDEFLKGRCNRHIFGGAEEAACNTFIKNTKHVILVSENNIAVPESIKQRLSVIGGHKMLEGGVKQFANCLAADQIPYYDELEALSLIVQTQDEDVGAKTLVRANEKWPGGRVMESPLLERAAVLPRGEDHVRLLLCMGEVTPDAPLRIKRHDFGDTLGEDHEISLAVRMTPGQGMAVVTIQADFLRDPIELDFLNGMSEKDEKGRRPSIAALENEMMRSFPPDAPHVVADRSLWEQVKGEVFAWIRSKSYGPNGGWFAKAGDLYPNNAPLPKALKATERLRRKNVFGNDPEHRYPTGDDFSPLFQKLRDVYGRTAPTSDSTSPYAEIVRVIAWTYQADNPLFNVVRKKCVERIVNYANGRAQSRPLPQEYTLCANLCADPQEWRTLWNAIQMRLDDKSPHNKVDDDLRLLYNLLQFHPTLLKETKLHIGLGCWTMMETLIWWYPHLNEDGQAGSKRTGYVLKSMLYLLRCRKFDDKTFVTQARDRSAYDTLCSCLKNSPKADSKKGLHKVVQDYLNGNGTIAGLPTD